jgi:hypothetical protein
VYAQAAAGRSIGHCYHQGCCCRSGGRRGARRDGSAGHRRRGGALLADSNGYPWNGRYIVASGNLLADFRANAAAEAHGRVQTARLYNMNDEGRGRTRLVVAMLPTVLNAVNASRLGGQLRAASVSGVTAVRFFLLLSSSGSGTTD